MQLEDKKFKDIAIFLDELYDDDDKAKELLKKAGLTQAQLEVVNTLIVTALQAYDRSKEGAEFIPR